MKNYFFVSQYYWPNDNATSNIVTRIVDVFTETKKANIITVGHLEAGERNENTNTIRIKDNRSLDKNKLEQRLLKIVILSIKMSISIFKNIKKDDIIITVTNPAFVILFLAFIKNIKKNKLIILVQDIFPENLLIAQIIKKNIIYKIVKSIFDYAYNKGDVLLVCGRDMQKTVRNKVKDEKKVIFIPNFGDTDILYPIEKKQNKIIKELQLEEKLVVLFTGNIGRMQDIDNLINTAKLLENESSIVFLFIGEGAYENKIKEYSNKNSNLFHIPNMNRSDAYIFLNAGDIGITTLLPNIMGVGVPSKTYSYMAAGKPIMAVMDSDSEIALMIKEEGNGWIVEPNNPEKLALILRQLKDDLMQIKIKGQISYELSKTKYSINNIINQYIKTINSI